MTPKYNIAIKVGNRGNNNANVISYDGTTNEGAALWAVTDLLAFTAYAFREFGDKWNWFNVFNHYHGGYICSFTHSSRDRSKTRLPDAPLVLDRWNVDGQEYWRYDSWKKPAEGECTTGLVFMDKVKEYHPFNQHWKHLQQKYLKAQQRAHQQALALPATGEHNRKRPALITTVLVDQDGEPLQANAR